MTTVIIVCVLSILAVIAIVVGLAFAVKRINEENRHANCDDEMSWSEKRTAVGFDQALENCQNKLIINNLILPGLYDPKHTTQVDTLIISTRGVFVIETKSWHGEVYGSPDQKEWTIYYDNGESHKAYNPTWQNNGHLKRVKQLIQRDTDLDVDKIRFIPMVVFYHGDIDHVEADNCFSLDQACDFIQTFGDVLDDETVNILKEEFTGYKSHPASSLEEHSAYVQSLKDEEENDEF